MKVVRVAFLALPFVSAMAPMLINRLPTVATTTVTIRYVDHFGKPWTGCHVQEFSFSQGASHADYASHFDGMTGHNIPFSPEYKVRLDCTGRVLNGPFYVSVTRPRQLILISVWSHVGDYHTGLGPRLTVRVAVPALERPHQTWVEITGVFLHFYEIDSVDPESHEARFYDLLPGRYLVLLVTGGKVACVKQIDFLEPGAQLELGLSPKGCEAKPLSLVNLVE
jgi:hypothetical protein